MIWIRECGAQHGQHHTKRHDTSKCKIKSNVVVIGEFALEQALEQFIDGPMFETDTSGSLEKFGWPAGYFIDLADASFPGSVLIVIRHRLGGPIRVTGSGSTLGSAISNASKKFFSERNKNARLQNNLQ